MIWLGQQISPALIVTGTPSLRIFLCASFFYRSLFSRWKHLDMVFGSIIPTSQKYCGINQASARGKTNFVDRDNKLSVLIWSSCGVFRCNWTEQQWTGKLHGFLLMELWLAFLNQTDTKVRWSRITGHKKNNPLKFYAINSPDGISVHIYGHMIGRRHEWTIYVRSGIDEQLPELLHIDGNRYCLYGDSGCSRLWYMEVPYQEIDFIKRSKGLE